MAVLLGAGAAASALIVSTTQAQGPACTITWTGDVDDNWLTNTSGNTNWSDDTLPDSGDHACLNNLATPYTVLLNSGTSVGSYKIESDASLQLGANTTLHAFGNSYNAGTALLQGNDSSLRTDNGSSPSVETLINTGTINASGGGAIRLQGDVVNQGTLTVTSPDLDLVMLFEGRTPKLTNSGTINVASGGRLSIDSSGTLEQTGTINGPGNVDVGGSGLLRVTGGTIASNSDVTLIAGNSGIAFVGASGATGNVDAGGPFGEHPISGNVPVGFSIDVERTSLRATANWTNAGTITVISGSSSGGQLSTEDGNNGTTETLTNTGTIATAGIGTQYIAGDLVNQGTISAPTAGFYFSARQETRGPTLTNSGTLTAPSGGVAGIDGAATLEQATVGTIGGPGHVDVYGLLRISGGTIGSNADVTLTGGGDVAFVGAPGGGGNIDAGGPFSSHGISGNVPAGYSIDVEPAALLQATANWTNAGTITLIGNTSQGTPQLYTENGNAADTETLTNTGTITSSGTGFQYVSGDLINQGTISVPTSGFTFSPRQESRPPKLTNSGTITAQSGGALSVQSQSTIEQTPGGTINGPGRVDVGAGGGLLRITGGTIAGGADVNVVGGGGLTFATAAGGSGAIDIAGTFASHPLNGNVPAGYSINVRPAVTLRATSNWTNAGTITLDGSGSELRTENANAGSVETMTNTGTLTTGGNGFQYIAGDLLNQGTISVPNTGFYFTHRDDGGRTPTLTNGAGGAITIDGSGRLDTSSAQPVELSGGSISGRGTLAGTLRNTGGDVRPGGDGIGTLTVEGTYRQFAGGTLSVDVATASGTTTNDRLATTISNIAGRLEIDVEGGRPALGTRSQIVTTNANQLTGTFNEVSGLLSGPFDVEYFPNRAELVTVPAADVPALSIGDASVAEGDAGSTDLVFAVTISPAPDAGTTVSVDYDTSDDTATAGSDYTTSTGTLTFAPGDSSEEIRVPVTGDTSAEPNETLLVRLRNPTGVPMRDSRAVGTIVGDETTLTDVSPDRGGAPGSVTVTVTGTGFGPASTLELERGGDTITGSDPHSDPSGSSLTATFDLTGALPASWDVAATGQDGDAVSSPGAFTIEPAREGRVIASATLPPQLRFGFVGRFVVTLRNTGNTDERIQLLRILGTDVEMRRRGGNAYVEDQLNILSAEPGDQPGPPVGILPANSARTFTIEFRSTTQTAHAALKLRAEVFTRDGLESSLERSVEPGSEEDATFPDPPGRIDGVVRNSNGQPLAGVPVTGEPADGLDRVVITGPNGQFAFTGLADGSYDLSLGGGFGANEDRRAVSIGPADRTVDVVFQTSISEVTGSVRAADGSRLGGATVHLMQGGELIDHVEADGAGGFRMLVLEAGTYDLVAFHEDIGFARLNGVSVAAGSATGGLRIVGSTSGLTVNTNAGAGVAVRAVDLPAESSVYEVDTGAGQVQVTDLAPGSYEVKTTLAGRAPRLDSVTVGAGTTILNAMLAPGAAAAGTVTGDGGAPLKGATVWAIDAASGTTSSDTTNAGGEYTIDTLTPGAVDLWFTAAGYAPRRISGPNAPAGGSVDVDAALNRTGNDVVFTAVAGTPANPIIGATVTVLDPTGKVPLAYALSSRGGLAALGPLPVGTYQALVRAPGVPPLRRTLNINGLPGPGDFTDEELLALQPSRSLHFPTKDTFEGLALEGKLRRDWFSTLEPPTRQGPDTDPAWRPSYQNITYQRPCPTADRLSSVMLDSSFDIQRTFANLLTSFQALSQVNQSLVDGYFTKSAEIVVKVATLGRKLASASKFKKIEGLPIGADTAIDLGINLTQNYRSGEGASVSTEQGLTSTLKLLARGLDNTLDDLGEIPAAGLLIEIADIAKDIIRLQEDLDKTYDRDFLSVIRGYESAEDQYHAAVRKHAHLMRLLEEAAARCPDDDDDRKPPPDAEAGGESDNIAPNDPNDIEGPLGVGPERWIKPDGDLGYTVRFENLGPGTVNPPPGSTPATAPAVLVTVEQTLPAAIDLDTFALGSLGWGDIEVDVPAGLQSFHGEVPLDDGDSVYVDASLDRATRKVTWRLETIDPETGELEDDPEGGFLPPEPVDDPGAGQGRVTYTARLLDGVAHGATVPAQASIVFDFNTPIVTPTFTNTVDRTAPASSVIAASQPGTGGSGGCEQELEVSWSGSDTGSGFDAFTILVSQDGGEFEPWLPSTSATSGTLQTVAGSRYEFISLARDRVGNEELQPPTPDQTIRTIGCDDAAPTVTGAIAGGDAWRQTNAQVSLTGVDGFAGAGVKEITYELSGAGGPGGSTVQEDGTAFTVGAEGITTVTYSGTDFAGNASANRTLEVRIDRSAPGVTIRAPAAEATIERGSTVLASYSCSDAASGIGGCVGSTLTGTPLPTDTLGQKELTVTATDLAGNTETATRSYTVVAASQPPVNRACAAAKQKLAKAKAKLNKLKKKKAPKAKLKKAKKKVKKAKVAVKKAC